jgi:hypothetical protein
LKKTDWLLLFNLEEGETKEHMAHRVWVAILRKHGCTCDLESGIHPSVSGGCDPDCPVHTTEQ